MEYQGRHATGKIIISHCEQPGLHASLKGRTWKEGYGSIDETVEDIRTTFAEYDNETLWKVWQSLFERYNQVLKAWGGNDFLRSSARQLPNGRRRGSWRQVFNAALDWWVDAKEGNEEHGY